MDAIKDIHSGEQGRQIDFPYLFSGFNSLTFINCYASVYMCLEKIAGIDHYDCPKNEGKKCNGCGNCKHSTGKIQEDFYFIMDTLSGRSSVRPDFTGTPDYTDNSPETIDFLMGFTGYGYRTAEVNLPVEIRAAIESEIPVLARMKDASNGAFRVLTGYTGDLLIMANPANAQNNPTTPTYEDIASVILITGKVEPRYTLLDGLLRIQSVMAKNRDAKTWDQYIDQFRYWGGKLQDADFEEIKRRFKRICNIAWYNFNCHNFAETFRHRVWEPLKDPRLDEVCRQINKSYDLSHTRNWQIIGLNECRDWSKRRYHELEWGYCTCIIQCLQSLKMNDSEVLSAIEAAISILSSSAKTKEPA